MLQIVNLTVVCAKRDDVLMQVSKGIVTVHVGQGPHRATLTFGWRDNEKAEQAIYELNFGKYAEKRKDDAA